LRSGIHLYFKILKREGILHLRQIRLVLNSSLFFMMLLVFFPLSLQPDLNLLRMIFPGIAWMAVLLAFLLSAERFIQEDYEYGVIEQWLISGDPLALLISAKMAVHWILNLFPLLILGPAAALLFSLSFSEVAVFTLSLICGTPAIVSICALAAVFSVGINQRSSLMALILLPLILPVMIFGSAVLNLYMQGLNVSGYLAILSALSIVAFAFLPFAIAVVIRISLVD